MKLLALNGARFLREDGSGVSKFVDAGSIVWLVADLDRCFGRDENPEHALVIANAVRWMVGDRAVLSLQGGLGQISATMYSKGSLDIIHFNNRLATTQVSGRQHELIPIRSVKAVVRARSHRCLPSHVSMRVSGRSAVATPIEGGLSFEVDEVFDHEVVVIDWAT